MQHDIVSIAGQLVLRLTPLEHHLRRTYPRHAPWQYLEELRVYDQLFLLRHRPRHTLPQLSHSHHRGGLVQLHRAVEHLQQSKVPDIPDKHLSVFPHQSYCLLQYRTQVLNVGEVLHYRVDHHRIKGTRRQIVKVHRRAVQQLHVSELIFLTYPSPQLLERRG